jgi:hypothetical protein
MTTLRREFLRELVVVGHLHLEGRREVHTPVAGDFELEPVAACRYDRSIASGVDATEGT